MHLVQHIYQIISLKSRLFGPFSRCDANQNSCSMVLRNNFDARNAQEPTRCLLMPIKSKSFGIFHASNTKRSPAHIYIVTYSISIRTPAFFSNDEIVAQNRRNISAFTSGNFEVVFAVCSICSMIMLIINSVLNCCEHIQCPFILWHVGHLLV